MQILLFKACKSACSYRLHPSPGTLFTDSSQFSSLSSPPLPWTSCTSFAPRWSALGTARPASTSLSSQLPHQSSGFSQAPAPLHEHCPFRRNEATGSSGLSLTDFWTCGCMRFVSFLTRFLMGCLICWWPWPWTASWWMRWMQVHLTLWVTARVRQSLQAWRHFAASTKEHTVDSCSKWGHTWLDFKNVQVQWPCRSWKSRWSFDQGVRQDKIFKRSQQQGSTQGERVFCRT